MSLYLASSAVTNGEVVYQALARLRGSILTGDNELCTVSVEDLLSTVREYLREQRGVRVDAQDVPGCLSYHALRGFLESLVDRLVSAGILREWSGEVVYQRSVDVPRFYFTDPRYQSYMLLEDAAELVEAQLIGPEFPKGIQIWGEPESLHEVRGLLLKAATLDRRELARFAEQIKHTAPSSKGHRFLPWNARLKVLSAAYKFVQLLLQLRLGELPISDVVDSILELQITFVEARALWWMVVLNEFVLQNFTVLGAAINIREYDIARRIFVEESERQTNVCNAIRVFNTATGNHLTPLTDFVWLNCALSGWDPVPQELCAVLRAPICCADGMVSVDL
jgi:hypothetical protein